MADIFLSYANEDVKRIKVLVEALEQQDWSVWWDYKIRVGKKFDQVIEEEIEKAKCIVVLWSEESVQSDWVKSEAAEGKRRQILVPALIDNVTIPFEFRRIETAKIYDWEGELTHEEFKLLLQAIGEVIQQPPKPFRGIKPKKNRFSFNANKLKMAVFPIIITVILIAGLFTYRRVFPPVDTFLQKVDGEAQTLPSSGWIGFSVKAVDGQGQPVAGAKVVWQTPYCGRKVWVGETDRNGISGASNMCSVYPVGAFKQIATITSKDTPMGFTDRDRVTLIGESVEFTFMKQ